MNTLPTWTPQAIVLLWTFYNISMNIIHDGEKRTSNRGKTVFLAMVQISILMWGGFFKNILFPQWIFIVWIGLGLLTFPKDLESEYNAGTYFVVSVIFLLLYVWGGFFSVWF